MKGTTMEKKTWKKIALSSAAVAVASIVVIFKLVSELEEVSDAHTDALKQLADADLIQNLKINGEPYEADL
ncbi:membrane protein [Arthrobacter phage Qui]|uniref:Membrane protein n=1 Tax=Arthrobacter phage Qui TaxID=2603260 RepID=A0A5B8WGD0_9CAUD|nr:membrane protein [Arthrobacter phage Qui]QED11543.1 membrane protein [Arthrobacter phage Qui]QOC56375.1 membrane protein [Arthrobacter phage Paella]